MKTSFEDMTIRELRELYERLKALFENDATGQLAPSHKEYTIVVPRVLDRKVRFWDSEAGKWCATRPELVCFFGSNKLDLIAYYFTVEINGSAHAEKITLYCQDPGAPMPLRTFNRDFYDMVSPCIPRGQARLCFANLPEITDAYGATTHIVTGFDANEIRKDPLGRWSCHIEELPDLAALDNEFREFLSFPPNAYPISLTNEVAK